jgi:hypothetical protein
MRSTEGKAALFRTNHQIFSHFFEKIVSLSKNDEYENK